MSRHTRVDHARAAANLRKEPGTWQPVGEYRNRTSANSTATMIRTASAHSGSHYRPAGSCEARLVITTDTNLVEARYMPQGAPTQYRVTYARVGNYGGRNGSRPPAPLTVSAATAESLAEHIAKDVRRYLLSNGAEVVVDLEAMNGRIVAGVRVAGTFEIEAVDTAEGDAQ
ncbi:hypothetical protein AB0I66_21370 [Streptomyces sp. NPDC050439]|uniref:hypothetical protein n=1 Tax=unclassified Streptomyces TaxID=2593676 RepID=UPI00342CE401